MHESDLSMGFLANKFAYKFATTMFTTLNNQRIGEDKTCRCDYKGRNGDI